MAIQEPTVHAQATDHEKHLALIRKQARERVERQLNSLWNVWGVMNREELGAMMDGAQEGVMEWLPPKGR